MTHGQTRLLAASLVALIALLIGFHGASTLLTVTQLGASPTKGPAPKSHASLVPQLPIPTIKPSEPVAMPAPRASELSPDEPAPATSVAADTKPMPTVPDNQFGVAAAAKAQAQAEMEIMGDQAEQNAPQPERRRRYRAPRPELHKVY